MNCKICKNQTIKVFEAKAINKYWVSYFHCEKCKFLQTEEPFWLDEAYSSGAISALDTGILKRNSTLVEKTSEIIEIIFRDDLRFTGLDYGGGEGVFVRMMRDNGYDFFLHDKYAINLYARYFDLKNTDRKNDFSIVTAFEVFEHLPDPLSEIDKMFKYSDIIVFSTELMRETNEKYLKEWWYIVPETGQHVSFYHKETLKFIAHKKAAYLYTNGYNLHILSKKEFKHDPFQKKPDSFINKIKSLFRKRDIVKRATLTQKDFDYVIGKLKKEE